MRAIRIVCLLGVIALTLVSATLAEVLQSTAIDDALWLVTDGATTRLRAPAGEARLDLPPGTTLDDLESIRTGWLATGRMPAGDGTELLLVRGDRQGTGLLPVPPAMGGRYRGRGVMAIDRGELVGMAWLEGDGARELEVWASEWLDDSWGPAERVSPRGPGSQVAPQLTVLADGSWMLVWAAFDGIDDEIVWSRRRAGVWSEPRRLHEPNDVPDITPKLVALGAGALAVWSRFDGHDYRLEVSRFAAGSWNSPRSLGGKGSGDPMLVEAGDGALLLFHTVETRSWWVLEIDAAGDIVRGAEVGEDTYEKPLLISTEDGGVRLVWPALESLPRGRVEMSLDWRELP